MSATNRTKFTITIQGKADAPPNDRKLVMIGTDMIAINVINSQIRLGVERDGGLFGSPAAPGAAIRFSDFDGGFSAAQADDYVILDAAGAGEPWGLV